MHFFYYYCLEGPSWRFMSGEKPSSESGAHDLVTIPTSPKKQKTKRHVKHLTKGENSHKAAGVDRWAIGGETAQAGQNSDSGHRQGEKPRRAECPTSSAELPALHNAISCTSGVRQQPEYGGRLGALMLEARRSKNTPSRSHPGSDYL